MNARVGVIDYGLGNLHSVVNACAYIGAKVGIATSGEELEDFSHLILPGVGAFGDGMKGLIKNGHVEHLKQEVEKGKPLLGVCLGAQLLLGESEEFGSHVGLGLIPGRVESIPSEKVKVPHVGWQRIEAPEGANWTGSILDGSSKGMWAYFIHSFHAIPSNQGDVLATCEYSGNIITAAVRRDNVTGMQFHPEKSGRLGLDILKKFVSDE
jgi:imidazole glycerol-phosphate synthase subunit HisH